ncbi:MAG: hypothetical protein E7167_03295 [Firmicutes bacterium]|nr:hypothetical protein [Bacillota bacterium]
MLKTKVGYSQNADAYASGVETAKMANLNDAKVGLLFTSCVMDQNAVVEGIRSVAGAHVLGCTSSAAICTHDGYLNAETGYSGIMSFGGDVEVGVAGAEKVEGKTAREIGRELAKEAMKELNGKRPNYFFMTASPKEEEDYVLGVQDVVGAVPVFGGSAADNTVEGKWSIICDDKVFADGCAICLFATDAPMVNIYNGQYEETEDYGIMTKVVNDRTLVEIDGVPAVTKYCEWTGKSAEEVAGGNLLAATIFDPLGVKDIIGRTTAVRHPMAANDDNSMNIGARLVEKTACVRLHMEPEAMVAANPKTIKEVDALIGDAKSYFLVHCGGRRLGLQIVGKEEEIYPAVKEVTGDKEFLMVFTFGEYGTCEHSANTVGGLSLSFTGFKN